MKKVRRRKLKITKVTAGNIEVKIDEKLQTVDISFREIIYTVMERRGMLSVRKQNKFDMADDFIIKPVVSNHIFIL
ncbi:MAG: hypothetical protein ACOC2U_00295 [bacterium]